MTNVDQISWHMAPRFEDGHSVSEEEFYIDAGQRFNSTCPPMISCFLISACLNSVKKHASPPAGLIRIVDATKKDMVLDGFA